MTVNGGRLPASVCEDGTVGHWTDDAAPGHQGERGGLHVSAEAQHAEADRGFGRRSGQPLATIEM
jgi:hypothetical protein